MQRLYDSRARRRRRKAEIERADAEAIQTKGQQKEETDDNRGSGCGGYTNQGAAQEGKGRQ